MNTLLHWGKQSQHEFKSSSKQMGRTCMISLKAKNKKAQKSTHHINQSYTKRWSSMNITETDYHENKNMVRDKTVQK